MSSTAALKFLEKHGMSPELVDPSLCADKMRSHMLAGLKGEESSLPMIPTYLSNDGIIPEGQPAVVIDAGGTNFRSASVSFGDGAYKLENLKKWKMPGVGTPATWEEFISFVADSIEPLMEKTDRIGFCFSYSADITPEIDGRVIRIDKEVVVTGSEGKLVGASLIEELERRGFKNKKVVILNDTVAVLLGGASVLDKAKYSGFIGQVSGTGTNTCCEVNIRDIEKLGRDEDGKIIINLESGLYDGIPGGYFDGLLDKASNNPGLKQFEKMTAGVYLGELCRLIFNAAAEEGLLSEETGKKLKGFARIDSADADAWSCGERLEEISHGEADGEFVKTVCTAMFERSARCMCTNLLAILLLTGAGKDKPACICAEGSLVQKGRTYRPMLEALLKEHAAKAGRTVELRVGEETTLPGSAAAAILNL